MQTEKPAVCHCTIIYNHPEFLALVQQFLFHWYSLIVNDTTVQDSPKLIHNHKIYHFNMSYIHKGLQEYWGPHLQGDLKVFVILYGDISFIKIIKQLMSSAYRPTIVADLFWLIYWGYTIGSFVSRNMIVAYNSDIPWLDFVYICVK